MTESAVLPERTVIFRSTPHMRVSMPRIDKISTGSSATVVAGNTDGYGCEKVQDVTRGVA